MFRWTGDGPARRLSIEELEQPYVFIKGWTPDGRRLLISPALTTDLAAAMLSIADGALQTIKSFGWAQVHATLSPDGRYIAYAAPVGMTM